MASEILSRLFFTNEDISFVSLVPVGYEHVLRYSLRPSTLGLQAAGRQGLQHAPHCVKGKKPQLLVHLCSSEVCVLLLRVCMGS